ncbi:hypothetical protein [Massilia sp. 9096]|uniref:hypothetical protein n=1 Tax=Massilia sp. 9096 TaxID=1500894 RepID=UPI00056297B0|nr:hypothetical protein [Massilia sp. 9096]
MRSIRPIVASLALLLAAGAMELARAQAPAGAGAWASYRDAYRAMVVFEKYGGPKNLLQSELEVQSADPGPGAQPLQLVLSGKATQLMLPLDALGRTVFPLQKAAYDENAALALNRKGVDFALRPRVTIAPRADGLYDVAELLEACRQALGFARWVDASQRARQCAGVRFVYPKKTDVGARLRRPDGSELPLQVANGAAFAGDIDDAFPVVTLRLPAERGQVMAYHAPLAIVPLFE